MEVYDLVGIGFGPANIGLAVALDEMRWRGSARFLERQEGPDWQGGMLLDGTDIQHHPLRDFVTPRNPTSRYGFLCYLKARDRLFEFLNLDVVYPLRKEYADYIRWVARHFDHCVTYEQEVVGLTLDRGSRNRTPVATVRLANGVVKARAISLAPGRTPAIPRVFTPFLGPRVVHFTDYLPAIARWTSQPDVRSVCVIGGSQSAIEITLDLARRQPALAVHNIQRGHGYQLKDTSPFTEEIYFPNSVDTFYDAPLDRQNLMSLELRRSNYGAADHDVIHQLYAQLYEQRLDGKSHVQLRRSTEVVAARRGPNQGLCLTLHELGEHKPYEQSFDAVILATGFRNGGRGENQELFHPLLQDIAGCARRRADGTLDVSRNYQLQDEAGRHLPVFLNGLCESTHGFGDAGSFSLLSIRSQTIAQSITQYLEIGSAHAEAPETGAAV